MNRVLTAAFVALMALGMTCASVWAQATAQISGTVKDQSAAVLPGVEVTATQTDTGISRSTVTNETGSYILPNLAVGPYRLEAGLPGFRTFVQTGIVLQVNSNPVINPVMEVGQVTETIEVQANADLVETRSTSIAQMMDNQRVLELAPYHLDLSPLDCEALDVLFAFDFTFNGNHDEVVAEALGVNTTLENLVQVQGTKVINYEPSLMLSLDETCRLQCRLSIETRTNAYQIRTGQFPEAPISVYFTIRQYWGRQPFKTLVESYQNQRGICQELVDSHVLPAVIRPLAQTIATKQ